ncbi:hypothetical protein [Campylobacter vulpis]|nr:hypothetical protein [Campylobacter vulpis]
MSEELIVGILCGVFGVAFAFGIGLWILNIYDFIKSLFKGKQ